MDLNLTPIVYLCRRDPQTFQTNLEQWLVDSAQVPETTAAAAANQCCIAMLSGAALGAGVGGILGAAWSSGAAFLGSIPGVLVGANLGALLTGLTSQQCTDVRNLAFGLSAGAQ